MEQTLSDQLIIANKRLVEQNLEKDACAAELLAAHTELEVQYKEKEKRAAELAVANVELEFQNKQKILRASELIKSNRLYAFVSQVNQNIVRVKDQQTLFKNACDIAVRFGRFKIAWIGLFKDSNKVIECAEQVGIKREHLNYFTNIRLTDNGPQQSVLKTKKHYINNDIRKDPHLETRELLVISLKIRSCIILPIKRAGIVIGTFNLFANELCFFSKDEIAMLNELTGNISFALDIFENNRKHGETESLVIENERRFRALTEKSPDMIALSKPDGEVVFISDSVKKGLGYTVTEMLGTSLFDLIHPDDLSAITHEKKALLKKPGKSVRYQHRMRHKTGTWICCEGILTNMLDEPGIHAFVSNFRDITAKVKAEQTLVQSETRLRKSQAIGHLGSWELNFATEMVTLTDEFCRIYGLLPHQDRQTYSSWLSFIHPDDAVYVKGLLNSLKADFKDISLNYRIVLKNGTVRYLYGESKFEHDVNGKPLGLFGIVHDVTESKLAERNLRQSESRLIEAQAIAHIANFEIDMTAGSEIWSDEMFTIVGINKEDELPTNRLLFSFIHPDDVERVQQQMNGLYNSSEDSSSEFRFIRHDGSLRYGCCEAKRELGLNGQVVRIYGILQDITGRKLAEAERVKIVNDLIVRNRDLEQFAYIVSHNLRSPVTNIIGASAALIDTELSAEEKEVLTRGINKSVILLDEVIKDLNTIIEVKAAINEIKEWVRFSDMVDDVRNSIRGLINEHDIEIDYDFSETNEFLGIKTYLRSIFYNLISNSIKYRRKEIKTFIKINSRLLNGKLELKFTDNGLGIDLKKNGELIFGLYKRFHPHIEGKGLGLFMVKTQVEILGGKISIQSIPNQGTQFTITFNPESI